MSPVLRHLIRLGEEDFLVDGLWRHHGVHSVALDVSWRQNRLHCSDVELLRLRSIIHTLMAPGPVVHLVLVFLVSRLGVINHLLLVLETGLLRRLRAEQGQLFAFLQRELVVLVDLLHREVYDR